MAKPFPPHLQNVATLPCENESLVLPLTTINS